MYISEYQRGQNRAEKENMLEAPELIDDRVVDQRSECNLFE